MKLYPMKSGESAIYAMQIRDRACTICMNVDKGGKICEQRGEGRVNWINAFEQEAANGRTQ